MIDYIIFTIAGIAVGYLIKHISVKSKNNSIETKLNSTIQAKKEEAKKIILDSKEESKKIILEAEEKAADILKELRKEESVIKDKLNKTEDRLLKKEEFIDQKQLNIDKEKEKLNQDIEKVQSIKESIEKIKQETEEKLNKVSGLSKEEAKNLLLQKIEDESKDDLYQYVKKLETTNKEEIEKKVQNIMQTAVQRYAHENNSENLITTVALPNEEIKGRIIGKEGRNIHHFEKITGVELIIDDTPDVITISSFNPVRREVARLALEKLIQDGRIQPAKIEEKVA
ncbi:MAG: Rnase Y domain-containing protein [Candidatus Pacebacteria bacterium]|nr:Rnase Y domain-containing protein [Candidatus Paceibacterota bacterium]